MDNPQEKIKRYEEFLVADPGNIALMITLGDLYHQVGRFEQARGVFTQVLDQDSANTVAASRLANVLMSEGRITEALAAFQSLVNAGEDDPVIKLNSAICQFTLYQFEQAETTFQQLAGQDAVGRTARYYLASIMQVSNRVEEALNEVNALLSERAEQYLYAYKSSLLYTLGRLDESLELANRVLADDESNPEAASTLGTFYLENLQADQARPFFDKITRRAPGEARGWHGLGMVALQENNLALACHYLEKAASILPRSAAMWTTLAWANFNSKQYKEAEFYFGKVIELDRNNPEGWGGKACALAMQNQLAESNKAAEYALRLDKQSFSAVFAKSLILALKGKQETGEKILSQLFEQPLRPGGKPVIDLINQYIKSRSDEDLIVTRGKKPDQLH